MDSSVLADRLVNPAKYGVPHCKSFHPGPDPKQEPMGWRPLCGRSAPSSIKPNVDDVTCRACLAIIGRTVHEEEDWADATA